MTYWDEETQTFDLSPLCTEAWIDSGEDSGFVVGYDDSRYYEEPFNRVRYPLDSLSPIRARAVASEAIAWLKEKLHQAGVMDHDPCATQGRHFDGAQDTAAEIMSIKVKLNKWSVAYREALAKIEEQ